MKTTFINIIAAALLSNVALSSAFECLIVCEKPEQHDPNAEASCNCAERYCPSGPEVPVGEVFGWNETANACGPVLPGEQCAGLEVTCNEGYEYGWNDVDTCKCLPVVTKRATGPVCDIACIVPSEHDFNAVPTSCNCDKKYCPAPSGPEIPLGVSWAFDTTTGDCELVNDPETECESLGVECIGGYHYGWSVNDTACECILNPVVKRASDLQCDIVCVSPDLHDPNATPTDCNCAERYCPPGPECAVNTLFGWDQEAGACGCVADQEAECVATDFGCVTGYTYEWDGASSCKCLPDASSKKRQAENVCHGILCTEIS